MGKPTKPDQESKPSNPEQVSKPAEKFVEQKQITTKSTKTVIEKDNGVKSEKKETENRIETLVFNNSNLNVNSEKELKNKTVEIKDISSSSPSTSNHDDCTPTQGDLTCTLKPNP